MTGTICLQGGAEFGPLGARMDADLLALAARGNGRVVVTSLAGAPGREYDTANANGVRHFTSLGATDVISAPDARHHEESAFAACREAALLVLPGGSPARLLDSLLHTRVGEAVREVLSRDGVVMGASAGAMVLCAWTWLPDQRRATRGLGLVPSTLVLPHWTANSLDRLDAVQRDLAPNTTILGIPEQSGVLVQDGIVTATGNAPTQLMGNQDRVLELGGSFALED